MYFFAAISFLLLRKKKPIPPTEPQETLPLRITTPINNLPTNMYSPENKPIQHMDNLPISNKELFDSMYYEKILQNSSIYYTPRHCRTLHEQDLSFNFQDKHGKKISELENRFETLYQKALDTEDLSEKILLLDETIKAYEKAKKFCFSKGKGGTIYFQDMWDFLYNSHNPCFSYIDNAKSLLEEIIFERDIAIPSILNVITENDGIIQKNIYDLLPDMKKSDAQRIIRKLESDNRISRKKTGSSYELHIANNGQNIAQ